MQIHVNLGSKVPAGITVDTENMVGGSDSMHAGFVESFHNVMAASPAIAYLIEYGLKQSLNDAIAAVKTSAPDYSEANTLAIVQKKLDAIMSGTVRQAGTREASDPIGVEAKKLATAWFKSVDEQKAKAAITATMRQFGIDDKEARAKIIAARVDHFREEAARIVAARKDAVAELADGLDDVLAGLINEESN